MATYSWSSLTDGSTIVFDPTADLLDFGSIAAASVEVVALDATTTLFRASGKSVSFTGFGVTQIVSRDLFGSGFRNVVTSTWSRIMVGDNALAGGGDDGPNVLTGHVFGNDLLLGLGGDDSLDGGGGSDVLDGGAGNDTLRGGSSSSDIATASYASAASGVTVSLALLGVAQNTGGAGTDTLFNIDNLWGSAFADQLTGGTGNNLIRGGGGDDLLDGGGGTDTADYSDAAAGVTVNLGLVGAQNTGLAGVDTLTNFENANGSRYADVLTGSAAANVLDGGAGDDLLSGMGGADRLIGASGDDTLSGGDGNDTLVAGIGNDELDGGGDVDTADYSAATQAVALDLDAGTAAIGGGPLKSVLAVENAVGTATADLLTGSSGNNALSGGNGDDTLAGLAGDDTLDGGSGTDTASYAAASAGVTVNLSLAGAQPTGGAGSDTLISIERLLGSSFADTLTGNGSSNIIDGGLGDDVLDGGGGYDAVSFISASGAVSVNLGVSTPQNTLGAGIDTLLNIEGVEGSAFADQLTGNDAANELSGYLGDDSIAGMGGADTLRGWDGNDNIQGGSGNDILCGGVGDDLLDGGADFDRVSYSLAAGPVSVDLRVVGPQATGEGSDTLVNVEDVDGGAFADTLIGNGVANVLAGNGGNDTLNGFAGNDTLAGATGSDQLDGGEGNDILQGGIHADTLQGALGDDYLEGGSCDYYYTGSNYAPLAGTDGDSMAGGAGNDSYQVTATATQQWFEVSGGYSLTTSIGFSPDLVSENPDEGSDTVEAYVSYTLPANVENLVLMERTFDINGTGNALNNVLTGNSDENVIDGAGGNDTLAGGAGNDTLTGGAGSDAFAAAADSGVDTVTDFAAGAGGDRALVATAAFSNYTPGNDPFASGHARLTQSGADTLLELDKDGAGAAFSFQTALILKNVVTASLVPGNLVWPSVSHAPSGADKTVSTHEGNPHVFTAADFGFSDPADSPANALLAVRISTLPAAGSLTLAGLPVAPGQFISASDLAAGQLVFTPAANASGNAYASFSFQVQDDGGTAIGGADLDPTPNLITVDVTSVNDAPSGADTTVSTHEDNPYVFTAADFGFSDAADSPANALLAVRISTLPAAGSLTLAGISVTPGQSISVADLAAGQLVFTPAAKASGNAYATFSFQVQDDGGTALGGADLDPTPNLITVDVTPVNDAPSGADKAVSTREDNPYVFSAADFGFSDAADSPANALVAVRISTLPAAGSLTLAGIPVTPGQSISVADLAAGQLVFTPAANASGNASASFSFQVQDDGGTADGGADLDPTPNLITIDLTPVNDAPSGADNTVSTYEDNPYVFDAADFGFSDATDTPANALLAVRIGTLPVAGSLTLSGAAVSPGQTITASDIVAGNLVFTPAANASGNAYASFSFQVQDDGGTVGGGIDLDPSANAITIDVRPLVGGDGDDHLPGGPNDNTLEGLGGNDTLDGGAGNDTLAGGAGDDRLLGGPGTDTARYSDAGSGVTVTLATQGVPQNTSGAGLDTLIGIENLVGSAFADTLTGDGNANRLEGGSGDDALDGGAGNDSLDGGTGNDRLWGGSGADSLLGGDGSDLYYVDHGGDNVTETNANPASGGTDQVYSYLSTYTLTAHVENGRILASGAANLTGNALDNLLYAGSGHNLLDGAGGNDTVSYLYGASGGVSISLAIAGAQATGGSGSDTLMSIEHLIGSNQDDSLAGDGNANRLEGGNGNDMLAGGAGNDTLSGSAGNDTASYADAASGVSVSLAIAAPQATGGSGTDTLIAIENLGGSTWDDTLRGDGNANRLSGAQGNDFLNGDAGNDTLDGGAGNDRLWGGSGADSLIGGDGSDFYYVDDAGDSVNETDANPATGGTDQVFSYAAAYTLGAHIENGRILATGAANITGNALDNLLDAGTGANLLDGAGGNDTVSYLYAVSGSGVSVSLALAGAQATGGSGSDTLAGIENLSGSTYDDTLTGDANANRLSGAQGNDFLNGGAGNDTLDGGAGNDRLWGGSGADSLVGGDGSDLYYLDDAGDSVSESNANPATGGTDQVLSYLASTTLGAHVENGRILTTGAANLAGNALDNLLDAGTGANLLDGAGGNDTVSYLYGASSGVSVSLAIAGAQATGGSGSDTVTGIENLSGSTYDDTLTGDANANRLTGAQGNDFLNGGAGNDSLDGGAGNDTLWGGTGADSLSGGDGADLYYVDHAGDSVSESNANPATGGIDQVFSYLAAYTLGANVENGRILATGAASLGGNALANLLYAGAGANVLDGGSGNDTASYLYGASSGVSVSLAVAGAQTTGGSGSDTLTGIENLVGSAYSDTLSGDGGANLLSGGNGNDTLSGGLGADTFRFDMLPNAATNRDTISDFNVLDDTIELENAIFTALLSPGTLAAGSFRSGAGLTTAADADDYLIYDSTSGALYYDANGNAGAGPVQIATLASGLALSHLDFLVT
ncbi:MAG: Ig-like domain-containing protein [Accumulibacter sp.]|jgi:Ca2+-binding RTX toxin-like protein|uniref:Ig-like domain-containing protein n=1 Tax=Accumulibacter sp. TaxID=2053492 RepID=UPI002FC3DDF2